MKLFQTPDRRRFLELRRATLARVPGFRGGPAADAQLASLFTRAETLGLVHLHTPDAQLMAFHDPQTWFGGPATLALVDRDARSKTSLRAALEAVVLADEQLDESTWLEVDAMDLPLIEGLLELGYGIDSVQMVGTPRVALERLEQSIATTRRNPSIDSFAESFDAARASDVDGILELHRRHFAAHPEHCFFGAMPSHLRRMRADTTRAITTAATRGGHPMHWVLRAPGGEVVAHVEAEVTLDHGLWGAYCGMALVFDPRLQGRGLARVAYRTALTEAVRRGATVMKGGTSQPAVMALARVMQRPWFAMNMRRAGATWFPPEHFMQFHPLR